MDVQLPGARAYAVVPEGARRGTVVIHEAYGRMPEIDRVVERFARNGYAAVAPDLWGDRPRAICLAQALLQVNRGEGPFIDVIRAARSWLCEKAGLDEKSVGLIGFCMGGGFALAAGGGFGAVSTNYGPIPPDTVLERLPPTVGCYGERDRVFGKLGPILEHRLMKLGVPVETHNFPEVGHSFLTDGYHPIGSTLSKPLLEIEYRPETAERGWEKILGFFEKNLA